MALESATYISDLVATNPVHATDDVSVGDDHIRLLKSTLLATFPNITGAVTVTHTELNLLAGLSGVQPLDADLTAIAALTTTSFGRSLLALADASAARTALGVAIGSDVQAYDADLAAIAALSTASFGRSLLTEASAATLRSTLSLVVGTNVQAYDADLAALAALSTQAFGRGLLELASRVAVQEHVGVQLKAKDADEIVNNSATLQDDDDLSSFDLVAGKFYAFTGMSQITGQATSDFKQRLVFTNAPSKFAATGIAFSVASESSDMVVNIAASPAYFYYHGYFQANATTGGTMKLQWAQNTAQAHDTTLLEGSWLRVEQVD